MNSPTDLLRHHVRRGDRFLHAKFLTESNTPAEFVVTKVTSHTIYYRSVRRHGAHTDVGSLWYAPADKFHEYVLRWVCAHCAGNNADLPCLYPGDGLPHCLKG